MRVLLVGTGYMAKEYAKVLKGLNVAFDVVGRGKNNSDEFRRLFNDVIVTEGGLENFSGTTDYTHGIICSNVDYLAAHTKQVIGLGISNILLEKPGGANFLEIQDLADFVSTKKADVRIAYNRRFYTSVRKCRELIKEDGGVTSFNFEFTEWVSSFAELSDDSIVKNNLLFANSTHVIDMAFFMGGFPKEMSSFSGDKLPWHERAIYSGAGISNKNAFFSYQANWKGPGRWSVEMITKERRFVFRPMEQLQVQKINSVKIEPFEIDDSLDKEYKPGLYLQTKTFLFEPLNTELITIKDQAANSSYYQKILEGKH